MHWTRCGSLIATVLALAPNAAPAEQNADVLKPIAGLLCDANMQSMLGSLQGKRGEADKLSKSSKKSSMEGIAAKAKLVDAAASIKALEGKIAAAAGTKLAGSSSTLSFLQSGKAGDTDSKQVSSLANKSCPGTAQSGTKSDSNAKDLISLLTAYFSKKEKK